MSDEPDTGSNQSIINPRQSTNRGFTPMKGTGAAALAKWRCLLLVLATFNQLHKVN